MRINTYNQKFENETKGRNIQRYPYSFINIFLTLSTIAIVAATMFIITKKTEIYENSINTPNLQTIRGKQTQKTYQISPSSSPSSKPANIPILMPIFFPMPNIIYESSKEYDDDDNIETMKRKSKYPTHHPKKPVITPLPTQATTLQPTALQTQSPTFIVVTDDFHVTPIIVINDEPNDKINDKKKDNQDPQNPEEPQQEPQQQQTQKEPQKSNPR